MHLWSYIYDMLLHSASMWNPSSYLPGIGTVSDFAKGWKLSEQKWAQYIHQYFSISLPSCPGLKTAAGLKKKAVPLPGFCHFLSRGARTQWSKGQLLKKSTNPVAAANFWNCCDTEHYQGLQPNVQTEQDKIFTINNCCRGNHTKFPTQYLVCHVSPN